MKLSLDQAENQVKKNANMRWDGWNIIVHRPNDAAFAKNSGRFNRDTDLWGYETIISPNDHGVYEVKTRR